MAKNKGRFNPKFIQKMAAQQASNNEFFKKNPGAYISNGKRIIPKPGDKRYVDPNQAQDKMKPAIKPNPAAGLVASNSAASLSALAQGGKPIYNRRDGDTPPNSNFQGLRDQLNSDRLTGGALGNINPAGNKDLINQLSGLAAPAADRIKPAIDPKLGQALGPSRFDLSQLIKKTPAQAGQAPGKPLGQAQPLRANQPSPEQPPQSPSVPFKESIIQQPEPVQPEAPAPTQPSPIVPPAPAQPVPAPQVVSPAAQMQAQKDQMFPPAAPAAPATPPPAASAAPKPAAPITPPPAAPPVAPKPAQVTPPAGVTKSQADINEEKKKQMAGMSGMAKTASGSF